MCFLIQWFISKESALKTLNKEKLTDYYFPLKTVLRKIELSLFAVDKTWWGDKEQISNTVAADVINYFLPSQDKMWLSSRSESF